MLSIRNAGRPCTILFAALVAVQLAACGVEADSVEDLGTLDDGKADTVLPRSVEIELAAHDSKRFRITTAAFVATLAQDGNVPAQLVAKHYEHEHHSAVSSAPRVDAAADGTVRNWSLTVYNEGDTALTATLLVDVPRATTPELGIVSDIDKTVLPPETASGLTPPYPGVAPLLRTLELREGGVPGDMHFVTARTPEGAAGLADWMTSHGVPAGPIETGISGVPWVAQPEKVADIARVFDARPEQRFVLFGDSSHRDPEVYAEIRARYPDRIAAIFIHKVNATVSAHRVEGMHLVASYAEAAAIAFGAGLVTEDEARDVIDAARSEGLALTDDEVEALLDAVR